VNISISTSHNFRQQCDCEISNAQNDGQWFDNHTSWHNFSSSFINMLS
jgi:hypothetical protein